jgi:hypothetical protein
MSVVKISDTAVKVTEEVTRQVTLDQLKAISANLAKSIANMQEQKAKYDAQIAEAIVLGVKTQTELKGKN